ncbi:GNAT family N-acetyltransferase [Nakamurella leprariae]|uniref:N-acetyltransferase n=1 Tax=Nakamurella leprariae TaxID=2803911 RepID=A0A938YAQ3_9ACTN|nr:N-acetyltransferase [Nakamurella leprariae]MBM9469020.1 N-acetyltransferase [Nakamurella leprariae]
MLIRRERPDDHDEVAAVTGAAFALPAGSGPPVEVALIGALRAEGSLLAAMTLVAVDPSDAGAQVIGQVTASRGTIAGRPAVGLGPVAVRPDRQHGGVGSALLHAVLGAADALGEPAVVLLGDQRWYARFGFRPASAVGVVSPDPAWGDHFQVRTLSAWTDALAGPFRYAPAFDGLE